MKTHGKNRIDNLQWAGAENYGFSPVLYGEDLAGNPDFYLNLILGLAAKYFGADTLRPSSPPGPAICSGRNTISSPSTFWKRPSITAKSTSARSCRI